MIVQRKSNLNWFDSIVWGILQRKGIAADTRTHTRTMISYTYTCLSECVANAIIWLKLPSTFTSVRKKIDILGAQRKTSVAIAQDMLFKKHSKWALVNWFGLINQMACKFSYSAWMSKLIWFFQNKWLNGLRRYFYRY